MGANVGHAIGVRIASGKRVSVRVLNSLSGAQLTAVRVTLQVRGKRLPESFWAELRRC